jgi:transcriptional antiterminator/mannitol/fructose-specific phosphotransferase system IIA component (Ntr-type)
MISRDIKLLEFLLTKTEYISFTELTAVFQKTERMIRYEVEKANGLLQILHLPQIEQNRKFGLKLTLNDPQKKVFHQYVEAQPKSIVYYTNEERLMIILFSILNENKPILGKNLADELVVSKSTIDSDMKKIRKIVASNDVTIKSEAKKGFVLLGEEWSIRIFINNFINEYIDVGIMIDNCLNKQVMNHKEMIISDYLDPEMLLWMYSTLRTMGQFREITLDELGCRQLSIMLSIWHKRLIQKHEIKEEFFLSYKKLHSYKIVLAFVSQLKKKSSIEMDAGEMYFLCYIIDSFNLGTRPSLTQAWGGVQMLTIRFIEKMEFLTSIPFSEDKEIFERLFNHIESLLRRIKNGVTLFNPLKSMIMEEYSPTFHATKEAIQIIETYCKSQISDDEIAYITVHFSASEEKLEENNLAKYRVVVICGHGVGTGALLSENLKKYYNFDVIGVLNSYNLDAIKRLDADFALKTIEADVADMPSLKIDPLLRDYDRKKIQRFLIENSEIKKSKKSTLNTTKFFKEICEAVERNSAKINMKNFIDDLEQLFEKNKIIINKRGVQPMISEILKDRQILLNKEAENWEDAIKLVAQPLLEEHYIKEEYITAMIHAVKTYGPYIVVGKGVALAHARPEDGVNKLGLSIMTLANPICFGHEDNDPVKIIFCLAAVDNFSHLNIMKSIVNTINQEWKIDQLLSQKDLENFKKFLFMHKEE